MMSAGTGSLTSPAGPVPRSAAASRTLNFAGFASAEPAIEGGLTHDDVRDLCELGHLALGESVVTEQADIIKRNGRSRVRFPGGARINDRFVPIYLSGGLTRTGAAYRKHQVCLVLRTGETDAESPIEGGKSGFEGTGLPSRQRGRNPAAVIARSIASSANRDVSGNVAVTRSPAGRLKSLHDRRQRRRGDASAGRIRTRLPGSTQCHGPQKRVGGRAPRTIAGCGHRHCCVDCAGTRLDSQTNHDAQTFN